MIFSRLKLSKTFILGTALAVSIIAMVGSPALAGPSIPAPTSKDYTPRYVSVSLLRQNDKSGEAYIHLTTQAAISGCPRVQPLRQTIEVDKPSLFVNVDGYSIDFSSMSRTPQYGCKSGMQFSTADIPLDRTLIEDNQLEQITFSMSRGRGSDTYKIVLNKNSLELVPETDRIFEGGKMPSGGQTALLHWYYPPNTVVLTAPAIPEGQRDQAIADYARSNNMTAIEEIIPEFVAPSGQSHRHYYVDDAGKTIENIPGHDDVAVSDMIYARRPGTYE